MDLLRGDLMLAYTIKDAEAEGLNVPDIIEDAICRRMRGQRGNPDYDQYSTGVYIGVNDLENRPEPLFFKTREDYQQWLALQ